MKNGRINERNISNHKLDGGAKMKQFKIEYRLTLKDGSYLETSTFVAAKDRDVALSKLKMWRTTQEPEFDKIEVFAIDRVYDVVV